MNLNFCYKGYDILGYALDGYVLCPACYRERAQFKANGFRVAFHDEEGHPIFACEDWSDDACDQCNESIFPWLENGDDRP